MKQTLKLSQFMGLNDYLKQVNKYRLLGNRVKRELTEEVAWAAKEQKLQPYSGPIQLQFLWVEANARRDPDNIVFAKKFILDGLQEAGIIKKDSQKYIKKFTDEWTIDPENAGVLVIIEEWVDDRSGNRSTSK